MIKTNFQNILFLDIETVPQYSDFFSAPEQWRNFWMKKAERLIETAEENAASLFPKAGIYSEFGKIICISIAVFKEEKLYVKSFYSAEDEKNLLQNFAETINKLYLKNKDLQLCAHNGKEFDFPYISRRMLVNRISIPEILNTAGKKPWEVKNIDTMELWKFGDYKNYTSLNLLAYLFNIHTPKDDIDGSMVYGIFYKNNDLKRIVEYCQRDVITVAQILRVYNYLTLIDDNNIVIQQ